MKTLIVKEKLFFWSVVLLYISAVLINQIIFDYQPSSDDLKYIKLADQYLALNFTDPDTNCYGHTFYACFISIVRLVFGNNFYFITIVQSLIYICSVLYLIDTLHFENKQWRYVLITFLFIFPDMLFFNGSVLSESLVVSLMLIILAVINKANEIGTLKWNAIIALPLLMTISIMIRVESIALVLALYFIRPKKNWKFKLVIGSFLILLSMGFFFQGLKNRTIYDKFKLTSFNGGEVIFGGNNMNQDGSHHLFYLNKEKYIRPHFMAEYDYLVNKERCVSCPKLDSLYIKMALYEWKNYYQDQIKVIPLKFLKNWLMPASFDVYTGDISPTSSLKLKFLFDSSNFNGSKIAPYKHAFFLLVHYVYLFIIIFGIFRNRKKFNSLQVYSLLVFTIFIMYTIPFCGLPRWHVIPMTLLIATFSVEYTLKIRRN